MNEAHKLGEARYFLGEMERLQEERMPFVYVLSAFLSAAWTALEYAEREAKSTSAGKAWHGTQGTDVIRFFAKKRNVTIHREPVEPNAHVEQSMTEELGVRLSESVTVSLIDPTGKVIDTRYAYSQPSEPARRSKPPTITRRTLYRFNDWTGAEDVVTLSRQYLSDAAALVSDGQKRGFLTA